MAGSVAELCLFESWLFCFGFASVGLTADLGAGVSESTRCALGRHKTRRLRRLLCCRRALSVFSCCVGVGFSWFGLVRLVRLVRVELFGFLVAGGCDV